ncbi:hypothetical protein FVEN_g12871 [Fusarium venenatum]|nr:hypothetical protein FVEN_g12871 [Fusarium venenatum]
MAADRASRACFEELEWYGTHSMDDKAENDNKAAQPPKKKQCFKELVSNGERLYLA